MMRLLTLTLLSSQPVLDFCRGRDAGCPAPPAQIRTGRIAAYGSYLGYLASKRRLGWGGGFWHSESIDRPTARTAPMSSGCAGSAAAARGTSARLPGLESCSDYPCCRA